MKVQQINSGKTASFGKMVIIQPSDKSSVHMMVNDARSLINREAKIALMYDDIAPRIIIEDSTPDEAKDVATFATRGYNGVLRYEFDKIINSKNPVETIIEGLKNSLGVTQIS